MTGALSMDERSYPTSEGGSQEELPHVRGQGAVAESTRLPRHRNGGEELPRVRGQGGRPRRVTPRPRPGAAAGRTNPTSKEPWLCGQEGLE